MDSICKFIPTAQTDLDVVTLNFVCERKTPQKLIRMTAAYSMCIVTAGNGRYENASLSTHLCRGSIFFTFQAKEYSLYNDGGLEFIYITFTGTKVNSIYDRLGISEASPVMHGFEDLIDFWEQSLQRAYSANIDLVAQSVLYYTFSHINPANALKGNTAKSRDTIVEIKKYIDDNFRDPSLCLSGVSEVFGYNANYISERFASAVGICMTSYITSRRMEYAKGLINEGFCVVSQIAESCGYKDALYFSKQFKKHYGMSPLKMISAVKKP